MLGRGARGRIGFRTAVAASAVLWLGSCGGQVTEDHAGQGEASGGATARGDRGEGSAGAADTLVGVGGSAAPVEPCPGLPWDGTYVGAGGEPCAGVAIADNPTACEIFIPEPDNVLLDFARDEVWVTYYGPGQQLEQIPRLDSSALCDQSPHGGWYYDGPNAVGLCPCTCSHLGASLGGTLQLVSGCRPHVFDIE